MMKALVIGATGAVGKDLVRELLSDPDFESVDIFVRRAPELDSPRLHTHVIDFERAEEWAPLLKGDVLFSCLATTIKAAGSQDAQWKVDYTYQWEAARAARDNGVPAYVLVSSMGADPRSKVFYTRMKGQLDEAVTGLSFPHCFILRPPSLIRKGSDRFGEKISVAFLKGLNAIGLLRPLRPMPTEAVASAMVRLAKGVPDSAPQPPRILDKQEILAV